jgi:transposase
MRGGSRQHLDDEPRARPNGHHEKKTLHATEREREKVCDQREIYLGDIGQVRCEDLIFVDEAGVNLAMAAFTAWAPKGQRAYGHVPKNWGDNISLIAGLSLEGIVAPWMLRGSTDGAAFTTWVETQLGPSLRAGHVVVMDNLSAHKSDAVRELIEARGAKLVFLPPYSPDLSPIEPAWSKIKHLVRKATTRSWDALLDAVGDAMRAVVPKDALGWFRFCGYLAQLT